MNYTMIKNYFKIAWRNLFRHKRMTFINIAGLGIGMAAAVLIAMWVQNELSYDAFQPDAGNIYRVKAHLTITKTETWLWESSPYILGEHAKKEIPEVAGLARIMPHDADLNLHIGDKLLTEKKAAYVDENWFKMFHYNFVEGSADEFNKNPFSLILTEACAKKYFGKQEAVDKVLRIDTVNYQVQAVVKDNPANSSFQYNMLIPVAAWQADAQTKQNDLEWGNYNYLTFIKLRSNSNANAVAAKLVSIFRTDDKDDKGKTIFTLMPLKDMHFETDLMQSSIIHGNRTIVDVFIVLAGLLLVTACINYVNLTTARASLRSKEVSVRKIVGADRLQLFGQFMSESLLVSIISLFLALLLVEVAMPWFRSFTAKDFGEPVYSPVVWFILGSTLLISFLLNGLYPAALLSSFKPINVFRGKSVLNFRDVSLRRILVVAQFTISVILIVGTLVIYRQLYFIRNIYPGYNRAQIFSFNFPYWKIPHVDFKKANGLMETVKQQLKTQSATSAVAMGGTGLVDFDGQSSGGFDWPGRPKDFEPAFAPLGVDPDFKDLMQLKMKEGRWFTNDPNDVHNVILNETAVRLINLHGDPIGQRFIHHKDTGAIIGVVKDFHYRSLHDQIGPMLVTEKNTSGFYIKTSPGNNAAAVAAAGRVWKQYFPDAPFDFEFLDDAYNKLYLAEQQQSLLITVFAAIAIFISALGLLGLAAFAAEQKVKEIGIRKVLGASLKNIVTLLSADFVKMVVIASVIACPLAWWAMSKWLQGFAYRINLSWWLFASAAGIALLIALVTVSFQAIKAAMANPAESLRSE